jgi:hypothetical protein
LVETTTPCACPDTIPATLDSTAGIATIPGRSVAVVATFTRIESRIGTRRHRDIREREHADRRAQKYQERLSCSRYPLGAATRGIHDRRKATERKKRYERHKRRCR